MKYGNLLHNRYRLSKCLNSNNTISLLQNSNFGVKYQGLVAAKAF